MRGVLGEMIIYISGAITGVPNNNKRAFRAAYTRIAELGSRNGIKKLKIINPLHIGARLRKSFAAQGRGEPEWADYMRACIKKLCDVTCAYFLNDWAQSNGASVERYIATRLKIPCADNMEELKNILARQGERYEHERIC
jgi:hypothetical protein